MKYRYQIYITAEDGAEIPFSSGSDQDGLSVLTAILLQFRADADGTNYAFTFGHRDYHPSPFTGRTARMEILPDRRDAVMPVEVEKRAPTQEIAELQRLLAPMGE